MPVVVNQTPEIKLTENNGQYTIEYGRISKGSKKKTIFIIENEQHENVRVSCGGCTTAIALQVAENIKLEITYSANSKGSFDKWVEERLTTGEEITFKLKGTVL